MNKTRLKSGGQILLVPVRSIVENPLRARVYYNDNRIDELIRSVAASGIVEPLTVCAASNGDYILISGERRLRAAIALNYDFVPCVLIESDAESSVFTNLSTHLTHDPLSFFEIAMCYEKLRDYFGLTYEETAFRLGVNPAEILEKVRLLQIPPKLRKEILEHSLSENYAKLLLRHRGEEQERLLNEIVTEHLSLREARKRSAELRGGNAKIRTFYKDVTVFINSLDRICDSMHTGGINAEVQKTETAESVEYSIRIPKPAEQPIG